MSVYKYADYKCLPGSYTLGYLLLKCVKTVWHAPISSPTLSASSVVLWRFLIACRTHMIGMRRLRGVGLPRSAVMTWHGLEAMDMYKRILHAQKGGPEMEAGNIHVHHTPGS